MSKGKWSVPSKTVLNAEREVEQPSGYLASLSAKILL
jgi:hypothetical protein